MSMTDPVSDFLTRVRNGITAAHQEVEIPSSKLKREMARILKEQGYIRDFEIEAPTPDHPGELIRVTLKYTDERPDRRRGLRPPRGVRHALQSRGQPLCAVRAVPERRERLMAKTSQRVRQARPNKYKTREYTRCRRCGRARSVYRKFGVCRICLRELAHNGYVPGMTKSSW